MWIYISLIVATISLSFWKFSMMKKIRTKFQFCSLILHALFKRAIKHYAIQYGYTSGEKQIAENLDMAKITYLNTAGKKCFILVPFDRDEVRKRRNKLVLLKKECLQLSGSDQKFVYEDITQEPGLPYLFTPKELGGKEIQVIEKSVNEYDAGEILLYSVSGDEKLPGKWNFLDKQIKEDIFF